MDQEDQDRNTSLPGGLPAQRIKLAIVDDDPDALQREVQAYTVPEILASPFHYSGYSNPEHLFDKLTAYAPDLIMLDLRLADDDRLGFEVLRRLRQREALSRVAVVFCSKLINNSAQGREFQKQCLALENVVGAYAKFPHLVPASELLTVARKR